MIRVYNSLPPDWWGAFEYRSRIAVFCRRVWLETTSRSFSLAAGIHRSRAPASPVDCAVAVVVMFSWVIPWTRAVITPRRIVCAGLARKLRQHCSIWPDSAISSNVVQCAQSILTLDRNGIGRLTECWSSRELVIQNYINGPRLVY